MWSFLKNIPRILGWGTAIGTGAYFWSKGTPEEEGGQQFSKFVDAKVIPVAKDIGGKIVDGIGNTITGATTTASEVAGHVTANPNAPADATRPQNLPLATSIPQVAQNAGEAVGGVVDTTKDSADGFVKGILGKVGLDKDWAPWITGAVALVGGVMAGKAVGVPGVGKVADLVTGVPAAIFSGIGGVLGPIASAGLAIGAIMLVGRWAFVSGAFQHDLESVKGLFVGPAKTPEVNQPVQERAQEKPAPAAAAPQVPAPGVTYETQQAVAGLMDKAIGGAQDVASLDDVTQTKVRLANGEAKGPTARRETTAGYGSAV